MAKDLPINKRIIEQLSKATVRTIFDGIVELVTNSDDSYRRLEETGVRVNGEILIEVDRKKGGKCERLLVKDFAEGMSKDEMERALEFAGETSGFEKGRSVRGLFGRGLKETIISLGRGKIKTIKNGKLIETVIWFDKKLRKPLYDEVMLEKSVDVQEPNCTEVEIEIANEKIGIPEYVLFKKQLTNHWVLREINTADNRKIKLIFHDLKRNIKHSDIIKFQAPAGELRLEKQIELKKFNDNIKIKIFESQNPLEFSPGNPFSFAGILIKTKSAILDNQFFKYSYRPAAAYFWGYAESEKIEELIRSGETNIIDFNRCGLQWDHEYCAALAQEIEKAIEPLIIEKERSLEHISHVEPKESTKKMIKKLCNLLNHLAKKELEEFENVIEPPPGLSVDDFLIFPQKANIQLNKPRALSLYAPEAIIKSEGNRARIRSTNKIDIQPLNDEVELVQHKEYDSIWYGYFKIIGRNLGATGEITAQLGNKIATASIRIGEEKKRTVRKGGFISDITTDELLDPPQRVVYINGTIKIYVNFPSVINYIKSGLKGVEKPEGRILLAEVVGEAFCKQMAIECLEKGKRLKIQGAEIDSFNSTVNEFQKKYLQKIQEIIFAWKLD